MATRVWQSHPCEEVQLALHRLQNALISWERATGRQSAFVIREEGGFFLRAVCGVPMDSDSDDIPDSMILDRFKAR